MDLENYEVVSTRKTMLPRPPVPEFKPPRIKKEKMQIHRITLRYPMKYHKFLHFTSIKTGLDVSALIRLAIHIAPQTELWKDIIKLHIQPEWVHMAIFPDWDTEQFNHLWKY